MPVRLLRCYCVAITPCPMDYGYGLLCLLLPVVARRLPWLYAFIFVDYVVMRYWLLRDSPA